ncbi:MAG: hypothetical protein V1866_02685 [archaeon]
MNRTISRSMASTFCSRRAQITAIVIFCIVLLIIFGFLLALKKSFGKEKPDTTSAMVQKLVRELGSGVVKDHVTSCLFKVASEGIERIGNDGGLIYDFDGGTIPFRNRNPGSDYLNFTARDSKDYHVNYGLRENSFCPKISRTIPDYPYPAKGLADLNAVYNQEELCIYHHFSSEYDGFFGQVTLPKLCYAAQESGCEGFAKGDVIGFTIQKQLEDYLAARLPLCVNLSFFEEMTLADISVDGLPRPEVVIHDSDVFVSVKYPLKITFENQEPVSELIDYQTSLNVRLGALYNFLYDVFSKDSKDVRYSIDRDFISSAYMRPGFELHRTIDACPDCALKYAHDSVVEVVDTRSILNGKPLLLRAAVQNRRPALDLILNASADSSVFEIKIPIIAYDPDDSPLRYAFFSLSSPPGGWQEHLPEVQDDLNAEGHILTFRLAGSDWGVHLVGILVIDSSGLFDYQVFTINISNPLAESKRGISSLVSCVTACSAYFSCGTDQDCIDNECLLGWCWVASQQCMSECGGDFKPSVIECNDCAESIITASDPEPSAVCSAFTSAANCRLPDCVWAKPLAASAGAQEQCWELSMSVDFPAGSEDWIMLP